MSIPAVHGWRDARIFKNMTSSKKIPRSTVGKKSHVTFPPGKRTSRFFLGNARHDLVFYAIRAIYGVDRTVALRP
jgi:hypothetical protein